MWEQTYAPILDNVYLSAAISVAPILFFLVALTFLKMKGIYAALITLGLQSIVSLVVFRMPAAMTSMAGVFGILSGVWPICYIIILAVWLYRIAIRSGKFEIIRASIASVSEDQRIQVILIAFCFGGFLEGAAAFGTPIAICGAMLVELGFSPLKATCLALIANAAVGSYGAIGIPVIVGAQQADLEVLAMSRMMLPTAQIAVAFVPLIQVAIVDGFRGIKDTVPIWLGVGLINSLVQSLTLYFMGPELTNILAAVASMMYLIGVMQIWSPSFIYRENQDSDNDLENVKPVCDLNEPHPLSRPQSRPPSRSPSNPAPTFKIELPDRREDPETVSTVMNSSPCVSPQDERSTLVACPLVKTETDQISVVLEESANDDGTGRASDKACAKGKIDLASVGPVGIALAWSPFILLTITVLIWSMAPFKALFKPTGLMSWAVVNTEMPWLHNQVIQTPPIKPNVAMPAVWSLTFINASGTAILIAIMLTIVTTRKINFRQAGQELQKACKDLWKACVMICSVMAVAYIANFSGASATIGLAVSKVGRIFPLLCPLVGWLGVFITGSVVNNNVLFAKLQSVTAAQIGVSPTLLVAANTAGGTMGKAVSPQSIAIAAAAVNMIGRESEIMAATLKHSIGLTLGVCVCTIVSSFVLA